MSRHRAVATILGAAILVTAGGIVVWSAAVTSSARVSDTTASEGFFAAGEVRLEQAGTRVDFVFDDDGLYPGRVLTGCVDLVYEGNVPVSIRLHGQAGDANDLDEYLDLEVHVLETCEAEPTGPSRFAGRLPSLWSDHPDYERGIVLSPAAEGGDHVAVFAAIEVVDDNAAQGLQTMFVLTAEARP